MSESSDDSESESVSSSDESESGGRPASSREMPYRSKASKMLRTGGRAEGSRDVTGGSEVVTGGVVRRA